MTCAGTGLSGMRQRDLIQWYITQQNEKNAYSNVDEAAAEVTKVKAIIEVSESDMGHVIPIFLKIRSSLLLTPPLCYDAELDKEGRLPNSCG